MASATLTKHDMNVLEKIKDPESDPSCAVLIDQTLSPDPHITDNGLYENLARRERDILLPVQQVELKLAGMRQKPTQDSPEMHYKHCVEQLGELIGAFPAYASARNNRAQALRRLYGDAMLVTRCDPGPSALSKEIKDDERMTAANMALEDLDKAVSLLTPVTPFAAVSPRQAKTLSMAHTQRAAIYHETSKRLPAFDIRIDEMRKQSTWTRLQFEEEASRDFALGGRYGCDIAKGLAVSTNPTAKLCGEMVREAMKKEYGPGYGA